MGLRATALLVCLCGTAWCEGSNSKLVWLRRLTAVGACAASFWDVQTTRSAVAVGALEGNGLLADHKGRLLTGRMIAFKAGVCAGALVGEELHVFGRRHDTFANAAWTLGNSAMAARFIQVSLGNRRVEAALRARRAPIYLLK